MLLTKKLENKIIINISNATVRFDNKTETIILNFFLLTLVSFETYIVSEINFLSYSSIIFSLIDYY